MKSSKEEVEGIEGREHLQAAMYSLIEDGGEGEEEATYSSSLYDACRCWGGRPVARFPLNEFAC